ncbi:MAG: cysteine--tRNA ligase [Eubacteriales bacterium]|nr:cysteine--tRNA ligase [Eubacteriales bacterium]
MKIYNTMSKTKEEFVPLHEGQVRMYVCGPTVYNLIHIGNARPMIVFDTVRRYFEYKGYEVNFVSNFTDVDDKIIKKANEEGVSASEISERYIAECEKDMRDLNIEPATTHPQATQEIDGMIHMIQTLIDKGFAYVAADGTVYYRTRRFKEYGKLSHKNIDDLRSGGRELLVTGDDQKEDPLDFVLWKPKKEGEPYWESPWCDGRPGWHIECSVMSKRYLGDEIDIHAGGEDLVFPHHENEIAQSEAANGVPFARYWMHNAFLNINSHKMSKSAGNFFTVRDIDAQYDPQVLRYFMLSVHYRSPLNFSAELMESAKTSYERIVNCAANLKFLKDRAQGEVCTPQEQTLLEEADGFRAQFEAAMDDDFNTADAITAIFELVKWINSHVNKAEEAPTKAFLAALEQELLSLTGVCGLIIERDDGLQGDEEAYVQEKIAERAAAKKAKDFARADAIRAELLEKGIVLEDTREGVKWKKV